MTPAAPRYQAFVSYGHADQVLAVAVRKALEQLAKPAYRRRIFAVFLDKGEASDDGTGLRATIERALFDSAYLVVVATAHGAARPWVEVEAAKWIERYGSCRNVVLLVAEGDPGARPSWDEIRTTLLPPSLRDAMLDEPRWFDFRTHALTARAPGRSGNAAARLTLDDPEFRFSVAEVQARLRREEREPYITANDIVDESVALLKAANRRRARAITALVLLTIAAVTAGIIAVGYARRSAAQAREALSKQLAAQSAESAGTPLDLGLLLGLEALHVDDTPDAFGALVDAARRSSGIERILHGHESPVMSVAFSAGGELLATSAIDGSVLLWDTATWQQVGAALPRSGAVPNDGGVRSLAFSPTAPLLAGGSFDGSVHLWDVTDPDNPSETALRTELTGGRSVYAIAFDPDGSTLVVGGGVSREGACGVDVSTVVSWDLATSSPTALTTADGCVNAVSYDSTGRLLAWAGASGGSGLVSVWDAAGARELATLEQQPDEPLWGVAFSPDGSRLAVAGDGGVVDVRPVDDLTAPGTTFAGHTASVRALAFLPDGRTIASADIANEVLLWDAETGEARGELSASHAGDVRALAVDLVSGRLATGSSDRKVIVWDLDRERPLATTVYSGRTRGVVYDDVRDVVVSSSGPPSGDAPGSEVIVWSSALDGSVQDTSEVESTTRSLARDPTTGMIASAHDDGTVILWDPDDHTPRARLERLDVEHCVDAPPTQARSVAFAHDSSTLAIGYAGGSIVVVDMAVDPDAVSNQAVEVVDARCVRVSGTVWEVAFDPAGPTLAASNGSTGLVVWDYESDDEPTVVGSPNSPVVALAFDPAGRVLAVGDVTGQIELLDADTLERIGEPMSEHRDAVQGLAFDAEGEILASVSIDGTMRLWNVRTRLPLGSALRGGGDLLVVAWTTEPAGLVTGGADGTNRWDLEVTSMRRRVCSAVNRELTDREWEDVVGSNRERRPRCDVQVAG